MNLNKIIEKVQLHCKCRNGVYPRNSHVVRFPVPDDKVPWNEIWTQYDPVSFTSDAIKNQTWADPPIGDPSFKPKWNEVDGKVNRKSHIGPYEIANGMPVNPLGRTGITGRGILGRWGPNHAADSILTRWKRTSNTDLERDETTKKPILQFVVIQRRDCGEWAIPGGMVDPGEAVGATLRREFFEEALSAEKDRTFLEELFRKGTEIYKGYVDDPRNTDNAWMETVATNFHDDDGKYVGKLNLSAGDDAVNAKWVDINSKLKLYASHLDFIEEVAKIRDCHW